MVKVDFSNPYLRDYLSNGYIERHRAHLDKVREMLPAWVERARRSTDKPLAAVFDIDEVILGNIHMNEFHAAAGEQGPDPIDFYAADYYAAPDGRPWPRDDTRLNPLLPGARTLLEAVRDAGVEIYMITGRLESIRDETVENFAVVGLTPGLFSEADLASRLIMCPDAEYPPAGQSVRPYKEGRRARIAATHHIVLNIGDQISDLGLHGDVQIHCPHPFYYCP